jgi:hypothetical protein
MLSSASLTPGFHVKKKMFGCMLKNDKAASILLALNYMVKNFMDFI